MLSILANCLINDLLTVSVDLCDLCNFVDEITVFS